MTCVIMHLQILFLSVDKHKQIDLVFDNFGMFYLMLESVLDDF